MADFKINGKNVVTQSGVAEPVVASNVTGGVGLDGVVATNITTGTLGNTVQDNITRLGTVASGNLSNAAIVYPAGHVIQHQYSVMGSDPSTTSTTFVTTGFSQAITLSNASNKVLITIAASCQTNTSGAYYFWDIEGTTSGFLSGDADRTGNGLGRIQNSAGTMNGWLVINLINLPGTTSAQTYTLHHHVSAGTGWANTNECKGHINLFEIQV